MFWFNRASFSFLLILPYVSGLNPHKAGQPSKPVVQPQTPVHQFNSPLARRYVVPTRLPSMDFDIGETYAGLVDISQGPKQKMKLFFWFQPAQTASAAGDVTLWMNGGPGCSSMMGALQELGVVMWDEGRKTPIKNNNAWNTRSHMLFVEHPNGVGYSTGNTVINNEAQVAEYMMRFMQAWLKIFPELAGKNFWIAGESYAGYYTSYLAELIYAKQSELALKLKGVLLVDPTFTRFIFEEQVAVNRFIKTHPDVFKFNATFLQLLDRMDQKCGYSEYLDKWLAYPATAPLPLVKNAQATRLTLYRDCDMYSLVLSNLARDFNIYNVHQQSHGYDPLNDKDNYMNHPDVRKALNVQGNQVWSECVPDDSKTVFPDGEYSLPPAYFVLPTVIAKSVRTVIAHGRLDFRLMADGIRLGLQEMTWNKVQGFKENITTPLMVNGKAAGVFREERGLTYIEVTESGHMLPHDQPEAGLKIFEYLLGQTTDLSH